MVYFETAIALYQNQNLNFEFKWPNDVLITLEKGGLQELDLDLFYKVSDAIEKFQVYVDELQDKKIETMKQKVVDILGEDFLVLFKVIEIPKPLLIDYNVIDGWVNGRIINETLSAQIDTILRG